VPIDPATAFVSYSREDLEFVQRLAKDLKKAGVPVWMDKLDIRPGQHWEVEIQAAVNACSRMLVILSPAATDSKNVLAEASFAIDRGKVVIPVLYRECNVPFRLHPLQYADFRTDYANGIDQLLVTLGKGRGSTATAVNDEAQVEAKTEQALPQETQKQDEAEQARLEQERQQRAAERERLKKKRKRAAARKARSEQLKRERLAAAERAHPKDDQMPAATGEPLLDEDEEDEEELLFRDAEERLVEDETEEHQTLASLPRQKSWSEQSPLYKPGSFGTKLSGFGWFVSICLGLLFVLFMAWCNMRR
jgi:hypothetical protein